MNILQVVHQFLPKYVGGTEVYVAELSRALTERGHQVTLFTGGDTRDRFTWEGMEVVQVPGGARGPHGPTVTFLSTFRNPTTEAAFSAILDEAQPDIVHFQHLLGLSGRLTAIASERGVRTCFTLHDYWFMCPKNQLIDHRGRPCDGPRGANCALCAADRLGSLAYAVATVPLTPLFMQRERAVREAVSKADLLLAPSRFLRDIAVQHGLPAENIVPVDFGTAADPTTVRSPREHGAPLRVFYLGALEQSKGMHVLIEACRLLDAAQLEVRIAGSLTAYPNYVRLLQRAATGLPITFLDAVPHYDVPALLSTTDVLVVPSLWYENSPLVIAEAFAAGVPVVASRIGALAEKVGDGVNGLLFTPGDSQALASALQRIIDELDLLVRLQAQTQGGATREQHVDQMERLYEQLAARAGKATATV